MINKILLSLYDYYRRSNDSFTSTFHSKALIGLLSLMICAIIYFFLTAIFEVNINTEQIISTAELKLVLFGVMGIIVLILWFATDSYKKLESKRTEAEFRYRKLFFIGFYLAIPVLIYLISIS